MTDMVDFKKWASPKIDNAISAYKENQKQFKQSMWVSIMAMLAAWTAVLVSIFK
jgi:hypothetical protein